MTIYDIRICRICGVYYHDNGDPHVCQFSASETNPYPIPMPGDHNRLEEKLDRLIALLEKFLARNQ